MAIGLVQERNMPGTEQPPLEVLMVGRDHGLESALLSGGYRLRSSPAAEVAQSILQSRADIVVVGPDVNVSDCINLLSEIRGGTSKGLPVLYVRTLGSMERAKLFDLGLDGCVDETAHRSELLRRIGLHDELFGLRRKLIALQDENDRLRNQIDRQANQLLAANQEVLRVSATDALTALANPRRFYEVLEQEWKRAHRSSEPLSLMLVDLDSFKAYNERYGHQAGDDAIRLVARTFADGLNRGGDFIARFGGEEFALLLPSAEEEQSIALAGLLRERLGELQIAHEDSPTGQLTASFGIATAFPKSDASPASLLASAEEALKRAKKEGRDRCVSNRLR
jgi:diguanylate cyclase (GGDEF)-like protein